jgi:hypothetical protein
VVASLAWTISLSCKVHLPALLSSTVWRLTLTKVAETCTNTVGLHDSPTPLHRVLLIGFHPSFTRKRIYYNMQRVFRTIYTVETPLRIK